MQSVCFDMRTAYVFIRDLILPYMEFSLQIVFGISALICLFQGTSLLIKGVSYFLPKDIPVQPLFDNIFRFLSGMHLGIAFLLIWVLVHIHEIQELNYFIGIVLICAGSGRLYSRMQVGSAGKKFNRIMLMEILLGFSILFLQYAR